MVSQVPEMPEMVAVHEVHSSTQSSSTEGSRDRTSRREPADYWENIVDCMHDYYNDENGVTAAVSLHEGVLYWMTLEEIERLQERSKGENYPEAKRDYEMHRSEQENLMNTLQQDYESANGRIEDVEEFKTALTAKDEDTIRTIVYQYASDIRERKALWKEAKIIEDNKKKERYREDFLREQAEEEEKQNKKRQRDQEEQEASASSAASAGQRTELQQQM
eukprot:6475209-Amphidinium_carterae.1